MDFDQALALKRKQSQTAPRRAPLGPAGAQQLQRSRTGTLQALTQLVNRNRAKAPKRIPPAKGLRRRFPGAPAGMRPNEINNTFRGDPSDASRRANFQRELGMSRRRNVGAPRRSAPRPPIY